MEHWEDWSWSVKSYVSLFKTGAPEVMENVDTLATAITDERLEAQFADTGLIRFSRQLHYLPAQLTESARLVVRGNVKLNGFETWRLLSRRFSPPTERDINLLTKVLEFRFRPDDFGQDYSEWETLKARYERQSGAPLPDDILLATMLHKTTKAMQQHPKLNG